VAAVELVEPVFQVVGPEPDIVLVVEERVVVVLRVEFRGDVLAGVRHDLH
jgi:hypothetical protein